MERSETLEQLASKLGMRVSMNVTFDTPKKREEYATRHAQRTMGSHIGDIEIAGKVRMLMRDEIDHEAVVCMARDRICALHVEKAQLLEALQEARVQVAILQDRLGIKDVGCGTLSIIDAAISKATGEA